MLMSEHPRPLHASHGDIIKRLRRAEGHLRGIVDMMEAGRSCLDISQQLHAVERAICQAKKTLIQDHLDHCLEDVVGKLEDGERRSIDEFREIAKYL
jgi:DNA-binding FrmR family transcriptional regulator